MKIRAQLLLACFVLSVLPLVGIVFYSYRSSRQALEGAYHNEATRLTRQMDRRLASIRADLDEKLAGLSAIPGGLLPQNGKGEGGAGQSRGTMVEEILMAMGEAAPLVDALEFVPTPVESAHPALPAGHPSPAAPPTPAAAPAPPAPPASSAIEARIAATAPSSRGVEGGVVSSTPAPGTEPDRNDSILIDLPRVDRPFKMPPDFHRRMNEIAGLSLKLAGSGLSAEERSALRQEVRDKQKRLDQDLQSSRESFQRWADESSRRWRAEGSLQAQRRGREEEERARQRERQEREHLAGALAVPPSPAVPQAAPRIVPFRSMSEEQKRVLKSKEKQAALLFGQHFNVSLQREGKVVGQVRAQLRAHEVVQRILGPSSDDSAEIPFAVDRENNVYTRNNTDRATLDRLGVIASFRSRRPVPRVPNWIIAMSAHKESGLRIGVARPVGDDLEELRRTAARNFGWGIGVIALALVGILPVAGHFTRDVEAVTAGAERIAQGDLAIRLPVRSNNEFGQLAGAFNRMAEDLSMQQEKLVEGERARREQDLQQRILALEYERKSVDLEEARRFQLSMLPKQVPAHPRFGVAALTQTATEVGGDYYDFHLSADGVLSVTIGDATGHGARAGTMVTIIKTLFAGYDTPTAPAAFLGEAAEKIKRMELGRMAMALSLARFDERALTIASAGMPPVMIHRAAHDRVDEVSLGATPLGTMGIEYQQSEVPIAAGDTVLLMSDGFPELQNEEGQQLGYPAAAQEFALAATAGDADGVVAALQQAALRWHGDGPPNDDVTFVVVRCLA